MSGNEVKQAVVGSYTIELSVPCPYWSSGRHVIANGGCRCGLGFGLYVMAKWPPEEDAQ